ncbi:hypothetical protein ACIQZG_04345 [Lysinibacillus sp. NPDC096418]|uniref:hypothetical protein n=1 Tax=Lysinibacillus sp. NPDC096418 TaxID=3364138 RepID=UPI00381AFCEB
MKAVLNVKGTKLSVLSIHYRSTGEIASIYAADENGRESRYIEKSHSQYETTPHVALDSLEDALEFPEHEVRIVEDLQQLLSDSKDHLTVLEKQIVQEALYCNGLPFGDSNLPNLVKEHKEHSDYIDGVVSALEVVKRDNYA